MVTVNYRSLWHLPKPIPDILASNVSGSSRCFWSSSITHSSFHQQEIRLFNSKKPCGYSKAHRCALSLLSRLKVSKIYLYDPSSATTLFSLVYVHVMHQSIPAAPIPPPGNCGVFARIVSPGGRALAYPRATPGLLTHVVSDSKSKRRRFYRKRPVVCHWLACLSRTGPNCGGF